MEVYPRRRMEKLRTFYSQSRARYIDSADIEEQEGRGRGDIVREKFRGKSAEKARNVQPSKERGGITEILESRGWRPPRVEIAAAVGIREGKKALLVKKRERERENEREKEKVRAFVCA